MLITVQCPFARGCAGEVISALSVTTYWHRLLLVALPLKLLEPALEDGCCPCGFAQGSVLGEGLQSPRSLNLKARHERAYERASSCEKWTSQACAGAVLVCSACLPCARAGSSALPLPVPIPLPLSLSPSPPLPLPLRTLPFGSGAPFITARAKMSIAECGQSTLH